MLHMCYNIDVKTMRDFNFHIGINVRAYFSDKQKQIVRFNGGAANFVYNRLVAVNREKHQLKKTAHLSPTDKNRLAYLDFTYKDTKHLRNAVPFLNDPKIDGYAIANAKQDYRHAWNQFRKVKGTSIPTFHKKDNTYSYGTNCHYDKKALSNPNTIGLFEGSVRFLDKTHIVLPILGTVRIKGSDKLLSNLLSRSDVTRIGTVRITLDNCDNAYLSISLSSDRQFHEYYEKTHKAVGIDMNLTNFLYDSDGLELPTPKYLRKAEANLKKEQRKLSRKLEAAKKDKRNYSKCKNYKEQRLKLARLHKHVANQRLDFIRNVVNEEVKNHDYLFAEDLKTCNLIKNPKLAKAISDSGWRMFLIELQNCASKRGKTCLLVNPKNTTQTCSNCGYVCHGNTHITLGKEEWICPNCGAYHIRDYNAGKNILATGLVLLKESGVTLSIK